MHGMPLSELKDVPTPVSPEAAPIASLLVRTGSMRGKRLPVRVPVVNIGRADYNDVVIGEPSVSTTHAKLQRRDDIWVLTDLGSTNGTFVEGEPVTGETALTPGTTLRFGEVAVLFEPLDDKPSRPLPGTQIIGRIDGSPAEETFRTETRVEEPEARPVRPRRPIRASAPKPSGPPAWLIALLTLGGAVAAYFFLTSS
jgi:pSer/pThr/pTyr-binding forkhead associated (FHA) protein